MQTAVIQTQTTAARIQATAANNTNKGLPDSSNHHKQQNRWLPKCKPTTHKSLLSGCKRPNMSSRGHSAGW
eukprot:229477-Chlamydomonas_euryale.AAC.3